MSALYNQSEAPPPPHSILQKSCSADMQEIYRGTTSPVGIYQITMEALAPGVRSVPSWQWRHQNDIDIVLNDIVLVSLFLN